MWANDMVVNAGGRCSQSRVGMLVTRRGKTKAAQRTKDVVGSRCTDVKPLSILSDLLASVEM